MQSTWTGKYSLSGPKKVQKSTIENPTRRDLRASPQSPGPLLYRRGAGTPGGTSAMIEMSTFTVHTVQMAVLYRPGEQRVEGVAELMEESLQLSMGE